MFDLIWLNALYLSFLRQFKCVSSLRSPKEIPALYFYHAKEEEEEEEDEEDEESKGEEEEEEEEEGEEYEEDINFPPSKKRS